MRVVIYNQETIRSRQGDNYLFRSRSKTITWPKQDGAFLGAVGAWNCLFRIGLQPEIFTSLDMVEVVKGDLLFVFAEEEILDASLCEIIHRWMSNDGTVVAGGFLTAWKWLLPTETTVEQVRSYSPYAALGWRFGNTSPELVAPPRWSHGQVKKKGGILTDGELVSIHGERQTPQRALVTPLTDAPAVIRFKNFIFLNGNPFAAFQSWLQGQDDLGPWLQWRHRLFWLDEQVAFLLKIINEYAQLSEKLVPKHVAGLPETVLVFRHDLDYSRDTSYFNAELKAGLPGVHAVLRDRNTGFWLEVLKQAPGHEVGFHYNTAKYSRWLEWVRSIFGLPKRTYRPDRNAIVGDRLLKQVRWAKQNHVGVASLHRHLPFLIYPEWVDALDYVFDEEPEVLGGSSLFRGQVLRWGSDRSDGARGTYGEFPDAQFPYWFPFKLSHAGLGGRRLRGWETTSVMEIEPELFEQMLDHKIPGFLQRVITINYHPAHSQSNKYCNEGSLTWWTDILQIVKERGIEVKTLKDIYATLDKVVIK